VPSGPCTSGALGLNPVTLVITPKVWRFLKVAAETPRHKNVRHTASAMDLSLVSFLGAAGIISWK
jgi:hypothetical protein